MSDLLDLFDDPAPPEKTAPEAPSPVAPVVAAPSPSLACGRPFSGVHRCRVGGGDACLSDDFGQSWFCRAHRPAGFFPGDPK